MTDWKIWNLQALTYSGRNRTEFRYSRINPEAGCVVIDLVDQKNTLIQRRYESEVGFGPTFVPKEMVISHFSETPLGHRVVATLYDFDMRPRDSDIAPVMNAEIVERHYAQIAAKDAAKDAAKQKATAKSEALKKSKAAAAAKAKAAAKPQSAAKPQAAVKKAASAAPKKSKPAATKQKSLKPAAGKKKAAPAKVAPIKKKAVVKKAVKAAKSPAKRR